MKHLQYPRIDLKQGKLHIATEPCRIDTVLGSCVSVTLYCPHTHLAAMNHAMLPKGENDDRFVNTSLPYMLRRLVTLGARRESLQAKLFGGANMFRHCPNEAMHIGKQNILAAQHWLGLNRIPLANMHVSGTTGRKIIFLSYTGQVFLKSF